MCGICGFTGKREDREEILQRMMDRMIHRGPDGEGSFLDDDIAMGFRRLAIIDLETGDQPMRNADGTRVITFNGEIYNYRELREELCAAGHVFSNRSDTEVLLHGFEEWGEGVLDRLRGMFAFAIWDTRTRSLFAARDPFGIKPFSYTQQGGELLYASEIKCLLEYPDYHKEVNLQALEQYLSFEYSVLPETFFQGIFKLLPGHFLRWHDGLIEIERYFDPMLTPEDEIDHAQLIEELDATLQESIRYHMVSDVEVASLLSSGVDSSYVACHFGGQRTYTVGFDYETYNEIPYAEALSARLGIENHSKVISTEEYWEALSRIQYFMDEPLADASASALYFVDREAAKDGKVILSGEGSDELFGGYVIYHEPFSLARYQQLPKGVRKGMAALMKRVPGHPRGKGFFLRGARSVEERFIGNANVFTVAQRNKVLKRSTPHSDPQFLTAPYYQLVRHLQDPEKMQYIDLQFWLPGDILLKADKMSMAHSLESRVPFLDREVFRVAKKIPLREKITDRNTKVCFREVAHRYLSQEQAEKKKLGFPVPIRVWLRQDKYYAIVKDAFVSPEAERFFHTGELVKLLDAHKEGKEDYARHIWTVYMFLLWYREYFVEGACSVSLEEERARDRSVRPHAVRV